MFVDSHCHLDFEEFDSDREAVLERANRSGVGELLIPAVTQKTWRRTVDISQSNGLFFALGLHPLFIDQHQPNHLSELDVAIRHCRPVAVGEIGLDYYDKRLGREKQNAYFSKQLIIAKQHDLPVVVHCRKAHDECIRFLSESDVSGGIIHAFNGSLQQANKYLEMGFVLGFGGMLTFARSRKLRSLVKAIPLQGLVLETDAPDMTVAQHRGQRNSPAYIPLIAEEIAQIRGVSIQEVAEATTQNFYRAMNLPT